MLAYMEKKIAQCVYCLLAAFLCILYYFSKVKFNIVLFCVILFIVII